MRILAFVAATLAALSLAAPAHARGSAPAPLGVANGLAQTPPMGWNSWNKFGCNINEQVVRSVADAMASSGMRDAGYQYVVIDDCWHGARDENGNIQADAQKFPSGVKAL